MRTVLAIADRNPLDQPCIANLYHWLNKTFDLAVVLPSGFESRSGLLDKSPQRFAPTTSVNFRGKVIGAKLKARVWALSQQCNIERYRKLVGCRQIGEVAASLQALKIESVIAVDYPALLAAQLAGCKAHLVSLELLQRSVEQLLTSADTAKSCMTQSWLRYLALFPEGGPPCFVVPNSPPFHNKVATECTNEDFILAGSAIPGFGLNVIADFINKYPARGTLLGWSPPQIRDWLRERGVSDLAISQISIQRDFLSEEEFIDRIGRHLFSFSIYDLRTANNAFFSDNLGIHPWSMQNYLTAFPGKASMCMNAGVPVIASNYPGMDFVHHYGVGAVVSDYSPDAIYAAKQKIIDGGLEMRRRCIDLAKQFCFDKCIQPFLEFVARDAS